MLLEPLVATALVMITWYVVAQCAVLAIHMEQAIERKVAAYIAVSTTLEKLRAHDLPPKNQKISEGTIQVEVACVQGSSRAGASLARVTVTALHEKQELLCIKTVLR